MKGPRGYQEDRFVVIPDLDDVLEEQLLAAACAYFAVFDGHSGAQAATYLETHLHHSICSHALFMDSIERAIHEACLQTDDTFLVSICSHCTLCVSCTVCDVR